MNPLLVLLLSSWTAAAPAPAPAAAPADPAKLDQAVAEEVKGLEDCVDTLEYFRDDLDKKKKELDKEFKGRIPSPFNALFELKRGRIAKQQAACSALVKDSDAPVQAAQASLRGMDADSKEYKARRKALDALRGRLNAAIRRFGAAH